LAVYRRHISFGFGADVLQAADRELLARKGYKLGKGTLQIRFEQAVPAAVIKRVLQAKARSNVANKTRKPARQPLSPQGNDG